MHVKRLGLGDVALIEPEVHRDSRGFFFESWNERAFGKAGIAARFVQDNHSHSSRGSLRGLHYQIRQAQGKLVRVVQGRVFDVAVDLRRSSPTCGKWAGVELSADNHQVFWVPPGFAHGFYVLSETADFLYKATDYWAPQHERCIRWDDGDLAVQWPIPPGLEPTVSPKDACGVAFRDAELYA